MHLGRLVLPLTLLMSSAPSLASQPDAILTFGDSLTQTWDEGSLNQRLAYSYCRKLDVIGRGYGGYNTEWALPILEQILPKDAGPLAPRIRLMTIWFGANDACLPPSPQHLPVPQFKQNLKRMISHVRSVSPSTSVVLITPPPIHGPTRARLLSPRPLDRAQDTTKEYANAVVEVGETEGVVVLDLWRVLEKHVGGRLEGMEDLLRDGLHLNKEGYKVLYDHLLPLIRGHFPALDPETLPPVFPLWSDIALDDVRGSVVARRRDEL